MKKLYLISIAFLVTMKMLYGQESKPLDIIAIGAHPNDCDYKIGGTGAKDIQHTSFLYARLQH